MKMTKRNFAGCLLISCICCCFMTGCATESHRSIASEAAQQSLTVNRASISQKIPVSIGKFANHSNYMNGVFAGNTDPLGSQAQTILITFMTQAGCYAVLDRANMEALAAEAGISNTQQSLKGAKYVIAGDIVEFGRKTEGDHQLWGILGHGKSQIAYAKVNINIIDVTTSAVVHSAVGAGEYELSNRDIVGFGSSSSYDSTLNGKVLSLAIREAVNNLTRDIDNHIWKP